jgi:MFS family permease
MLFVIMIFAAVVNFVSAALQVLVVLVLRTNGVSSEYIGLILSCSGVGAIVGSVLAPWLVKRLSVPVLLLSIGVGWSAALGAFALFYAPWFMAALLTLLMTLSPAAGVVFGQALFSRAPRDLLGRVGAATSVMLSGLAAVGPLLAGVIFAGLGRSGSWLTFAAITVVITAGSWVPLQATRNLTAGPVSNPDPNIDVDIEMADQPAAPVVPRADDDLVVGDDGLVENRATEAPPTT